MSITSTIRLTLLATVCMALGGCSETGDAYIANIDPNPYPPADGPGEAMDPDEIQSARRIAAIIEAHLTNMYPNGQIRRDAHPKSTGCVDATFTVNNDIPAALRVGIFAEPGRSYRAVIRFSNSNEDPTRPDRDPDGRGMAIKLFDLQPNQVPMTADPLAALSPRADMPFVAPDNMTLAGSPSQDFIMISHPVFAAADAVGYRKLVGNTDSTSPLAAIVRPFVALEGLGISGIKNAMAITSLKIDNPLYQRYWSMVPYRLGTGPSAIATKFSVLPVVTPAEAAPDPADPEFLRHAMVRTLAKQEAKFVFAIQPRTETTLPVEDPRVDWPESVAPFHNVATITVPTQNFNTAPRNTACELLSYSPWHALPEHRPLGAVNRMRKVIYETISGFRRAKEAAAK